MSEFICNICGHSFNKLFNLNKHLNKPISCDPVIRKNVMKENRKRPCQYCGTKLSTQQSLNRHLNICKVKLAMENGIISELEAWVEVLSEKVDILEMEFR